MCAFQVPTYLLAFLKNYRNIGKIDTRETLYFDGVEITADTDENCEVELTIIKSNSHSFTWGILKTSGNLFRERHFSEVTFTKDCILTNLIREIYSLIG